MKIAVMDIGGTEIKYCVCDPLGINKTVPEIPVKTVPSNAGAGAEALLKTMIDIICRAGKIDGIAISTAGQVDPVKGSIIFASSHIPGYTGTRLKELLENKFKIPVSVRNDANCAALGEVFYGAGKDYGDLLCLTYGTGIGGGIVKNGKIEGGSTFSAGEFGFMITHGGDPNGKIYYEDHGSTTALIACVREKLGLELNGRQIFDQMKNDPGIERIVISWMDEIILGLVSLIHIFDPACILLGGGIMNETYITDYIRNNLPAKVMESFKGVEIRKAALGNRAGMLGAIHEFISEFPHLSES